MRVFIILFAICGVMVLYQIPDYDALNPVYHKFFLLSPDIKMTWRNYLWHMGNNVRLLAFFYIIYYLIEDRFKGYAKLLLIMQGLLFTEFVLRYNSASFSLMGSPVGLSYLFIIFNALIVAHLIWKNHK